MTSLTTQDNHREHSEGEDQLDLTIIIIKLINNQQQNQITNNPWRINDRNNNTSARGRSKNREREQNNINTRHNDAKQYIELSTFQCNINHHPVPMQTQFAPVQLPNTINNCFFFRLILHNSNRIILSLLIP